MQMHFTNSEAFLTWNRRLRQQGWALRWAVVLTLAVLIIPMMVLVFAGLLVGVASFVVLSLVAKVMEMFGAAPGGSAATTVDQGEAQRKNVRVIQEEM